MCCSGLITSSKSANSSSMAAVSCSALAPCSLNLSRPAASAAVSRCVWTAAWAGSAWRPMVGRMKLSAAVSKFMASPARIDANGGPPDGLAISEVFQAGRMKNTGQREA